MLSIGTSLLGSLLFGARFRWADSLDLAYTYIVGKFGGLDDCSGFSFAVFSRLDDS